MTDEEYYRNFHNRLMSELKCPECGMHTISLVDSNKEWNCDDCKYHWPVNNPPTAKLLEKAIWCLNTVYDLDPEGMHRLIESRVEILPPVLRHPHVVGTYEDDLPVLGVLELLCGVMDAMGLEKVAAVYESGEPDAKLLGFTVYNHNLPEQTHDDDTPVST